MNDIHVGVGSSLSIDARFLACVAASPQSTAISFENREWTYAEVERQSSRLAASIALAVGRDCRRIAILADRRPELIIAILAASRLGATFFVLDNAYPEPHLHALLSLATADILVGTGGQEITRKAEALAADFGIAFQDAEAGASAAIGIRRSAETVTLERAAYFLFTSGSTGRPKCVAATHAPLNHFIEWHVRHGGFHSGDRFSMTSGLSHDPLLRDIFTPLSIGARLAIPSQKTITEPGKLKAWFREAGVTVAHLTPAMGQLLVAGPAKAPPLRALRHVFWGGDQLREGLVRSLAACAPQARQTNFYGCTETPQAISYYDIDVETLPGRLPVGRAVDGFDLSVVDEEGHGVPPGVTGSLRVRSRYLSAGYVVDGVLQAHRHEGVYDTGDRALLHEDGNLMLLGRGDDQIKIRGYRVDLSEVTRALAALPRVASALALAVGEGEQTRIVGFVAGEAGARLEGPDILSALHLPSYMIPSRILVLSERWPLLPNGKTDRQALIRMAERREVAAPPAARAASPSEAALIQQWQSIFPDSIVTPDTSFVSLGGDSLSYVQTYLATEDVLVTVPVGWVDKTIAELALASTPRASLWRSLDPATVTRSLAIVMIVLYHFGLCPAGEGLTGAFFLVSGYLLASLQLKGDVTKRKRLAILSSAQNIFVPTAVVTAVTGMIDQLSHIKTPISALLFYVNWTNGMDAGVFMPRHDIIFWYVDCLLQMLLAIYLVALGYEKLRGRSLDALSLAALLFGAGLIGRFALPLLFPAPESAWVSGLSVYHFGPFSNIATLALGMLVFAAAQKLPRLGMAAVVLAYGLLDGWMYGPSHGASVALAALLLIFVERIWMPRSLSTLCFTISGASLYIYLTQFISAGIADKLLKRPEAIVETMAALCGGILAHRAWTLGRKANAGVWRRWRKASPGPAAAE